MAALLLQVHDLSSQFKQLFGKRHRLSPRRFVEFSLLRCTPIVIIGPDSPLLERLDVSLDRLLDLSRGREYLPKFDDIVRQKNRSEERRVGKEGTSLGAP